MKEAHSLATKISSITSGLTVGEEEFDVIERGAAMLSQQEKEIVTPKHRRMYHDENNLRGINDESDILYQCEC